MPTLIPQQEPSESGEFEVTPSHTVADVDRPATSEETVFKAGALKPDSMWPARISVAKDVIGIVQNLFAIGAIVAAGFWFYLQRPFAPTFKTTSSALVTKGSGYYVVSATAIFENNGHVPFHFNCWGVSINSDSNPLPAAHCGGVITLNPGEQRVVGDVITVPDDQVGAAKFVRAEIGSLRSGGWDLSSQASIQVLLFENGPEEPSKSNKSKKPPPNPSNSSIKLPAIQQRLKEIPYTAERKLTPEEIEEQIRIEGGTA
jgi:hypothetical protein